jgi:hypothetical protein
MNSSTTSGALDVPAFRSGDIAELGFLSKAELWMFSVLIRNRRSLPVHRDGFWACYECPFESDDLGATAMHILRAHKPAPLSDDEIVDGISLEVG